MLIIQSKSHTPSFNLAAEEYLFSQRQDEILFLYVNAPSVVIGSNQAVWNEVDLDFCAENNIQVVRRMSGGGAVYHDEGNLNYCFISNRKVGESALGTDFLNPIVIVLRDLSVDVEIGKRKDLWLPGGYKISGTASHIAKNRELHHGTLLYDTDLETLQKALTAHPIEKQPKAIASVPSPVINIKTYLKKRNLLSPDISGFLQLFILKMFDLYELGDVSNLKQDEISKIEIIQQNKYESSLWTFKK